MTTPSKATQAATQLQLVLTDYWRSNAENARLRSEVAALQGKVRSLETLNAQIMREKIHLADHLDDLKDRRGQQRSLKLIEAKAEVLP